MQDYDNRVFVDAVVTQYEQATTIALKNTSKDYIKKPKSIGLSGQGVERQSLLGLELCSNPSRGK